MSSREETTHISVDASSTATETPPYDQVGIPPAQAKAIDIPSEWKDDILSFHPNDTRICDPYGPPEFADTTASFVAVTKVTNPVARDWVERKLLRDSSYVFTPGSQMQTNDALLVRALGSVGVERVCTELTRRLTDLERSGLATRMRADNVPEKLSPKLRAFLDRMPVYYDISRECFYSTTTTTRLECLSDAKLPSTDELVAYYLTCHEGSGGAVAIPVSFLNRAIRTMKK
jgi:hypothetical protein